MLSIVLHRPHLRKTTTIALIVGLILTAINQGDSILAGEANAATWIKTVFNFLVPFTVSNLGLLAGHSDHEGDGA